MTIKIEGQLEIDVDRGVVYFHANHPRPVVTVLRICRLKIPKKFNTRLDMIDITAPEHVSYGEQT